MEIYSSLEINISIWLSFIKTIPQKHVVIQMAKFSKCSFYHILWGSMVFHGTSWKLNYRKTSNISRTLVGNKIVDNSDVVGASLVGAAPTTSSLST